jgi:hypothetical protein
MIEALCTLLLSYSNTPLIFLFCLTGFANDADAERQREFFEYPMETGKFKRISYFEGLSTTDIIKKIRSLEE